MPNQHKPLPPEHQIRPFVEFYYHLGLNDKKIESHMRDHYNNEQYGLSTSSIKRLRRKWGLKSTRQQRHTIESIASAINEIRQKFPSRGAETIRKELRVSHNIRAPREVIMDYLKRTEPNAVKARRHRRFKRRRYFAAGINDVWAMDQHDKWGPRFGLWLHNGIDPFITFNLWMKVWWTNKNPRLIASYYLKQVRKDGSVPVVTQSDPGSENYIVANLQTIIRHDLDPCLAGSLQHRFKRNKTNVKSEANWSVFRRDFAPGYEDLFESGVNQGWYDVDKPLENLVFRWIAIPWIQSELDKWVTLRNRTASRSNTKKITPHGIPELMRERPNHFDGVIDFKIGVPDDLLDELEEEYIPSDHPVFQLTPPAFHDRATTFYEAMGSPAVTISSFWNIYRNLLQCFLDMEASIDAQPVNQAVMAHFGDIQGINNETVPLLPGMEELREGGKVMGNLNEDAQDGNESNSEYADFTDKEDEDGEENSEEN
ncbi:hypothetical protein BJ912DRAFT_873378 [Pholiota molesta]|nr:hypothetical protein BJ912DRAFT_873378 [Pholiota molesta]